MAIDLQYWNEVAAQLDFAPQYRDPAYNDSNGDSNLRERGYVSYFIIHHTATPNEALAVDLMQPGGRTVSAQWVLCVDGKFRPIIRLHRRAYTSSSWLDDIADTVETVNVTSGPSWEISDLEKMALALMAVWKYRNGRLGSLTRTHIVGHYEVLGISGSGYVTACPGPDMQLDLIVELANAVEQGLIGPSQEDTVKIISYSDRHERNLEPGESDVARNAKGAPQDVSGGLSGAAQFTQHIYADGAPGDVVEVTLLWNGKSNGSVSEHFTERITLDRDGLGRASIPFTRVHDATTASVTSRVRADADNSAPVRVWLYDTDVVVSKVG